jgi:hypothetical protein
MKGIALISPARATGFNCGDQAIVHLSLSEQHFSNERQGHFDHVAFQTTDLRDLPQRLDNAGIEYSSNHVTQLGMTQVFLKSPSATGIEVNCLDAAT